MSADFGSVDLEFSISQFSPGFQQENLDGNLPFYLQEDYIVKTTRELAQTKRLPSDPNCTWNTEHKAVFVAKQIFSVFIFPIVLLHALATRVVLWSASNSKNPSKNHLNALRSAIPIDTNRWKYKRFTLAVDGYEIDTVIMGMNSTLDKGRWVLGSFGACYEEKIAPDSDFSCMVRDLNSNAIVFNCPGMGASSGLLSRRAMEKAYRAILTFLEDRDKGIGATQIIGYGHSIGATIQASALNKRELKPEIKYVFVKSMPFSRISTAVSLLFAKTPNKCLEKIGKCLEKVAKIFGWNGDSVVSSKKLQAPEIIVQSANVNECQDLAGSGQPRLRRSKTGLVKNNTQSELIKDDGKVKPAASLAKALLEDPEENWANNNKVFLGVPEGHHEPLSNGSRQKLVSTIENMLLKARSTITYAG